MSMDIQAEKIELVKWILDTEDEALIRNIKSMISYRENEVWEELPAYVREGVERAINQANSDKVTTHVEVMKNIRNIYS